MSNFFSSATELDKGDLVRAWGVHLFTASGAICGFLALLAIIQQNWRVAMCWIGVTIMIDSIDGMLARRFRVKELLPGFDGALLDNMVDYFTYTIVPAVFLFQLDLLPSNWAIFGISLMVLASSYQFAQADAKDEGEYIAFKGFPSYWNVMAVYLLMLNWPPWVNLAVVLFFSLLVFIPIRYVYHSRTVQYRKITMMLTAIWVLCALGMALTYPHQPIWLVYGSFYYVIYYAGMSFYLMRKW